MVFVWLWDVDDVCNEARQCSEAGGLAASYVFFLWIHEFFIFKDHVSVRIWFKKKDIQGSQGSVHRWGLACPRTVQKKARRSGEHVGWSKVSRTCYAAASRLCPMCFLQILGCCCQSISCESSLTKCKSRPGGPSVALCPSRHWMSKKDAFSSKTKIIRKHTSQVKVLLWSCFRISSPTNTLVQRCSCKDTSSLEEWVEAKLGALAAKVMASCHWDRWIGCQAQTERSSRLMQLFEKAGVSIQRESDKLWWPAWVLSCMTECVGHVNVMWCLIPLPVYHAST